MLRSLCASVTLWFISLRRICRWTRSPTAAGRIALLKPSALGRHRPRPAGARRAAGALPGRRDHLGREQGLRAAARRPPGPDGHARRSTAGRSRSGPADAAEYTLRFAARTPPPAVRPRHRPARAAPHRADGRGHRGAGPGRVRQRPRGQPALLHAPRRGAGRRPDSRRRPLLAGGRGARGGRRAEAVRRAGAADEAAAVRRRTGRAAAAVAGGRGRVAVGDEALAAGALRGRWRTGAGRVRRHACCSSARPTTPRCRRKSSPGCRGPTRDFTGQDDAAPARGAAGARRT